MKKNQIVTDFKINRYIYLMLLPVVLYYLIFCYGPMYGMIIAFKEFSPAKGILGSPWVGFKHFKSFFSSMYFGRVVRNTISINLLSLIFGFPAPIIFALLLNEIRNKAFVRGVQTISYLPHLVSTMVICGIIVQFTSTRGIVNDIVEWFGGERLSWLSKPE